MVERVERRFDLRPRRLAGDTAYGAVRLLKWLVDRNIAPHVPVWDKSARPDGTFSRADLVFDQVCPGGAELTSTGNIDQGHIVYYRASKNDCSRCSLKPKCTTATDVLPATADDLRVVAAPWKIQIGASVRVNKNASKQEFKSRSAKMRTASASRPHRTSNWHCRRWWR